MHTHSHFGTALQHVVSRVTARMPTGWTLLGLARAAGVSHSILCRYISGATTRPTRSLMRHVVEALSAESRRMEALNLVAAHLRDEIDGAGLIENEIRIGVSKAPACSTDRALDSDMRRLRTLADHSEEFRALLHALRIVGEHADHAVSHLRVAERPAKDEEYRV